MSVVDAIKRFLCNVASATSVRWNSLKLDGIFAQGYTAVTAGAAGQTTAQALTTQFTRITAGATGTGVYLPLTTVSGSALSGQSFTVRNDSAAAGAVISVWPTNAAANNGTINNAAANSPYLLAWGDTQTFTSTNGIAWFTSQYSAAGNGSTAIISTGDTTLTVAQLGSVFTIPASGAASRVINLPPANTVPQGARYIFVATGIGDGTHLFTITPNAGNTDTLNGCVCRQTTVLAVANAVSIAFSTAYKQGDWLEVICVSQANPGTNAWFVKGIGSNVASFA